MITPEDDIDSIVAAHLAKIHPNHVNEFGLQKTPRAGLPDVDRDGSDADDVYFIRVPESQ